MIYAHVQDLCQELMHWQDHSIPIQAEAVTRGLRWLEQQFEPGTGWSSAVQERLLDERGNGVFDLKMAELAAAIRWTPQTVFSRRKAHEAGRNCSVRIFVMPLSVPSACTDLFCVKDIRQMGSYTTPSFLVSASVPFCLLPAVPYETSLYTRDCSPACKFCPLVWDIQLCACL